MAGEIVETVIINGITYLVKRVVDALGRKILQFFRDMDKNGLPDTDNPEFYLLETDDGFGGWEGDGEDSGEGESGEGGDGEGEGDGGGSESEPDTSLPSTDTSTAQRDYVIITPDGPIVISNTGDAEKYDELVSQSQELWVQKYGALDKPLHNYSVTECLLFIVAVGTVIGLVLKIFKRRKL